MTTENELTVGVIACDLSSGVDMSAVVSAISNGDEIIIVEINHLTDKMSEQEILAMMNERSEEMFDDMIERFNLMQNHFPDFEQIDAPPITEHDWYRRFEKIRTRKGKY